MSPRTKRAMKSGSSMSKKPKLYDTGPGKSGSSTTIALWPKRSKKISPGSMVATPTRGAAWASGASSRHSASRAACAAAIVRQPRPEAAYCARAPRRVATPVKAAPRRTRGCWQGGAGSFRVAEHGHVQRVQPARVGTRHAEAEAAEGELLAGLGQVADGRGHQAADGVVLVVIEVGAEAFVEVVNRGQRIDHGLAVGLGRDQRVRVLGVVVLVVDLAADLLEHVLDRHQSGHAAILVDHDRHVVARLAEFAQQHVELLRLGD